MAETNKSQCKFYLDADVEKYLAKLDSGIKSRVINEAIRQYMTVKLTPQQVDIVRDALNRAQAEMVALSGKCHMLGHSEYYSHYKQLAATTGELDVRLKNGEQIRRGSTEMSIITEALFSAEVQVRNDDLSKAKSFYLLRKELESRQMGA